jgi:hypothetical protein
MTRNRPDPEAAMIAFFGLGTQEIILLALLVAVPAIIAMVVYLASTRSSSRPEDRRD